MDGENVGDTHNRLLEPNENKNIWKQKHQPEKPLNYSNMEKRVESYVRLNKPDFMRKYWVIWNPWCHRNSGQILINREQVKDYRR